MSSVYNLEPTPTAKVLLQTTEGDLELELFAKQTPVTSRNFLQLCLDGYYDNTIFHRLVPGFIIQGGDPTGTGHGGESSYDGEPFADEFHSRLKFNRRGLLAMANTGKKNDNGSQFFLTLGNTPELTGKNTLFGRIAGDTIYNLMKMGEADLAEGSEDRPMYPTKIKGTEILVNPFEDMVRRARVAERTVEEKKVVKKPKRKAGKALLSFGGDDGEDGDTKPMVKKAKFNTKLISAGELTPSTLNNTSLPSAPETEKAIPIRQNTRKSRSPSPAPKPVEKPAAKSSSRKQRTPSPSTPSTRDSSPSREDQSLIDRTNAQIAAMKESMRRNTGGRATAAPRKKSALEAMIPPTSTRGRKRGVPNPAAEKEALDMLTQFRAKLEAAPPEKPKPASPPAIPDGSNNDTQDSTHAEEEEPCDLHFIVNCQSCTAWDKAEKDAESDDDAGWMSHKLTFEKDRLGKDLEWKRKNEEELVVIDPREKAKELLGKGKKGMDKGKGRA